MDKISSKCDFINFIKDTDSGVDANNSRGRNSWGWINHQSELNQANWDHSGSVNQVVVDTAETIGSSRTSIRER